MGVRTGGWVGGSAGIGREMEEREKWRERKTDNRHTVTETEIGTGRENRTLGILEVVPVNRSGTRNTTQATHSPP